MTHLLLSFALAVSPVQLRFQKSPEAAQCLDEAALRSLVRERLGEDPFHAQADTHIAVVLRADARGFEAELKQTTQENQPPLVRTLRSTKADCSDLGPALAFALALAVDPLSFTRAAPIEEQPENPPPPTETPAAEMPAPDTTASPPLHWHVGLGAHGAFGAAPSLNGGVSLEAGVRAERWEFFLGGRGDWPGTSSIGGGDVSASLLLGQAGVCFALPLISVCGTASGGALQSLGVGYQDSRAVTTPWVAVGTRATGTWLFASPLGLRLFVDLQIPLFRTVLRVGDVQAWSTPAVAGALGLLLFFEWE